MNLKRQFSVAVMCKKQGLPVKKQTIVSAVKNVASALQLASLKKGEVSTNKVIKPNIDRSREREFLVELKHYLSERKEDKLLVATIDICVKDYIDLPCLVVTSEDLENKDFGQGLGDILLEPKGCIFFETKKLSKDALSRVTNILNKFVELWDSRLIVLLETNASFPSVLGSNVEKFFETKDRNVSSPPPKRKRIVSNQEQPAETVSIKFHKDCIEKKEIEISDLKKELHCCQESLARSKDQFESLEDRMGIQEDLMKDKEEKLKSTEEAY